LALLGIMVKKMNEKRVEAAEKIAAFMAEVLGASWEVQEGDLGDGIQGEPPPPALDLMETTPE
jgi:hypothetical protein